MKNCVSGWKCMVGKWIVWERLKEPAGGGKMVFPSFGWLKMHDKVGFLSDKDLFSFGKVGAGGEKWAYS